MQDIDHSSCDTPPLAWESSEASSVDFGSSVDETAAPSPGSPRWQLSELMPLLKARAFKLCRDAHESEDLVQETLLRALRFESNFVTGTNLRAWLCTVLGNVFISRCRSRQREKRALTDWSEQAPLYVSTPANPEAIERFSTTTECALSTSRIGMP